MNKSDFDYFMALYNTESLSKAATVCHTDKSTISKSIIKLEKDLNTKLFDRENGRYIPLRSCVHFAKFIDELDDVEKKKLGIKGLLKERIGHKPKEVFVGLIYGAFIALIMFLILK